MGLTVGYHYGPSADLLVRVGVRHEPPGPDPYPFEDYPSAGSASILCTGIPRLQDAGILKTVGGTFLFLRTFSKNGRFTFLGKKNVHQKRSVLIFAKYSCRTHLEGSSTREPPFSREMWAPFSPRKFASSILLGVKRSGADFFLI